jgi:Ribbon-helix-helix protein, copG family
MKKIQIQLPEALLCRLRSIAQMQGVSLSELIRRGMDLYVMSCPEVVAAGSAWTMPVLRGSGGHLMDPASVKGGTSAPLLSSSEQADEWSAALGGY